jgi:hypothetical protein
MYYSGVQERGAFKNRFIFTRETKWHFVRAYVIVCLAQSSTDSR